MKPRLVLGALMPTDVIDRARTEFDAVVAQGPGDMTGPEIISAAVAHRADAIMFVNTLPLDAATIAALPASVRVGGDVQRRLRPHRCRRGAGRAGSGATNTPDVLTECTADHTVLLLLAAARRAIEYDRIMRQGWGFRIGQGDLLGVRVTGKTLGILGMGRIGQAVARRARGFDMRIVYHARQRLPPAQEKGAHVILPRWTRCCRTASSCRCMRPPAPATDRIMNRRTLGLLPEGAVLVNVARGSLVDEDALIEALTGAAAETRGGGFAETSVAKPAEARTGGPHRGIDRQDRRSIGRHARGQTGRRDWPRTGRGVWLRTGRHARRRSDRHAGGSTDRRLRPDAIARAAVRRRPRRIPRRAGVRHAPRRARQCRAEPACGQRYPRNPQRDGVPRARQHRGRARGAGRRSTLFRPELERTSCPSASPSAASCTRATRSRRALRCGPTSCTPAVSRRSSVPPR